MLAHFSPKAPLLAEDHRALNGNSPSRAIKEKYPVWKNPESKGPLPTPHIHGEVISSRLLVLRCLPPFKRSVKMSRGS